MWEREAGQSDEVADPGVVRGLGIRG